MESLGTGNFPGGGKRVVDELLQVRELAAQLQLLLRDSTGDHGLESGEELLQRITKSFTEAIEILCSPDSGEVSEDLATGKPSLPCDGGQKSEDSGEKRKKLASFDYKKGGCKRGENIQISVIGDSERLPVSLRKLIAEAEEITKNNRRFQLIIAVSYSGQYDIVQACRSIAEKVNNGLIQPNDITDAVIEQELETNCTDFPHPDLLIRTSGEQRVSNFLLWQLAYTEFVFVQPLWPDFGEAEFVGAISSYQQRRRRYGGRDS